MAAAKGSNINIALLVLATVSLACLLACLFSVFLNPAYIFPSARNSETAMTVRLFLILGMGSISALAAVTRGYILYVFVKPSFRFFLAIALVVPAIIAAASIFAPDTQDTVVILWLFYATSFVSGCACALCMAQWGDVLRQLWCFQVGKFVAGGFIGAVIFAYFFYHLNGSTGLLYYALLQCCAVLLLSLGRKITLLDTVEFPSQRNKFPLSFWHELYVGIYALIGGVFFDILFFNAKESFILEAAGISVALASAAYIFTLVIMKKYLPSGLAQKALLIPIMASLLLAPMLDTTLQIAAALIVVAAFFYMDISNFSSLLALSEEYSSVPFFVILRGRLFIYSGLFLGMFAGFVALKFVSEELCRAAMPGCFVGMALLLLALTFLRPFEMRHVDDREVDNSEEQGTLQCKCDKLALKYDLTTRESDVLLLLARGRNARYISEELFISTNTAKTHISHVYRKLGIGSQQSLLDLVEEIQIA